ncbi:hypothetical protein ASG25_10855 [Rhizobium sp. Leaf384]|uniref:hypothetical protein n=1 Tax=Rhizobium sp. Leaf384 TaxID=1736358 RepID=UPI000714536E|nr:hypothetical protein [Rhizobium sp. Leaf384]KQS79077.1 hypothetical protein ASG25_10855 [Rhizobium sp. Leaf384]
MTVKHVKGYTRGIPDPFQPIIDERIAQKSKRLQAGEDQAKAVGLLNRIRDAFAYVPWYKRGRS